MENRVIQDNPAGPLIFLVIYILATVFFLPGCFFRHPWIRETTQGRKGST